MLDTNFDRRMKRQQSRVNFILMTQVMKNNKPQSFNEAVNKVQWKNAMESEFDALVRNDTWTLMELPLDKDVIGTKWIYKTKYKSDGSIDKHKARLVAKGYAQQEGVDYTKTFAPVATMDTIKTVLVLAAQHGWISYQMDIKSAFLNGYVNEEIYVKQPQGFNIAGNENKVYKLKKALYGFKQAPRAWYSRINTYFQQKGFHKISSDPNLYIKVIGSNILIIFL
eukprot:Gb_02012 [translate_table: standard]